MGIAAPPFTSICSRLKVIRELPFPAFFDSTVATLPSIRDPLGMSLPSCSLYSLNVFASIASPTLAVLVLTFTAILATMTGPAG